ncbi:MAG TPA: hypothetical protein PLZ43_15520 [bacterium]|nr:hypothetical protein [bacterium]
MSHLGIIIDWYGPFQKSEAFKKIEENSFKKGLYLLTGKVKYQRDKSCVQYIGLSKDILKRLKNHEKVDQITKEQKIWLGKVASCGISGKKSKVTDRRIDDAESAMIYFMCPPMNKRKKKNPPQNTTTVVNRWWSSKNRPRRSPEKDEWPRLIDYMGEDGAWMCFDDGTFERKTIQD